MAAERKRGLTQQEIDKMRAEKTAELMKQADLRSRKAEVTVKSRYASYVIGELDDNAICVVQVPLSIKPGMSFLVRVGDEEDLVSITPPPEQDQEPSSSSIFMKQSRQKTWTRSGLRRK